VDDEEVHAAVARALRLLAILLPQRMLVLVLPLLEVVPLVRLALPSMWIEWFTSIHRPSVPCTRKPSE
jgi:hypothetical protein